jgi:glycosyltransferase involved in cell wall biosynthesis
VRVGVWFEVAPDAPIAYEGLTRLLFLLVEHDTSRELQLSLVVAPWSVSEISAAVAELPSDMRARVTVVLPLRRVPPIVALFARVLRGAKAINASSAATASLVQNNRAAKWIGTFLAATRSRLHLLFRQRLGRYFTRLIADVACRGEVACWLVLNLPTSFADLPRNQPVVALLADYAYSDFPDLAPPCLERAFRQNCQRILDQASRVITMSSHVAMRHAFAIFGIDMSRISVIKSVAFRTPTEAFRQHQIRGGLAEARDVLRQEFHAAALPTAHATLGQRDARAYVFMPTQTRSYKNIENVVRAIAILNRDGVPLTLVTTGGLSPVLLAQAKADGLSSDAVLSVGKVSFRVLHALYICAGVVVHVSRFEGGVGAFPLFEGIVSESPVVLSRNLATMEYCDDPKYVDSLVDQDDVPMLARRIWDALTNRNAVVELQLGFASFASSMTWSDVSSYYCSVLCAAIKSFPPGSQDRAHQSP